MRAIVCTQLGDATAPLGQGPLSLALDHPRPALPPHHVRIRVVAASLNFPDALQIKVRGAGGRGAARACGRAVVIIGAPPLLLLPPAARGAALLRRRVGLLQTPFHTTRSHLRTA